MSVFATIVIILLVLIVIFLVFLVAFQSGMAEGQSRCLASTKDVLAKIGEIIPSLLPESGDDVTGDGNEPEKEQANEPQE